MGHAGAIGGMYVICIWGVTQMGVFWGKGKEDWSYILNRARGYRKSFETVMGSVFNFELRCEIQDTYKKNWKMTCTSALDKFQNFVFLFQLFKVLKNPFRNLIIQ